MSEAQNMLADGPSKVSHLHTPDNAKYQQEGDSLLEPRLTRAMRLGFIVLATLFLSAAIFVGYLTVFSIAVNSIPLPWRVVFVLTFVSCLVLGILAIWVLKAGVLKVKTHLTAMIWVATAYCFCMAGMTLFLAPQVPDMFKAVQMPLVGSALFIGGLLIFTFHHLHLAALENRKKLWDIEHRLTEITEGKTKK